MFSEEGTLASRSEKLTYYVSVADTIKSVTQEQAKSIAREATSNADINRYMAKVAGDVVTIYDESGNPLMHVVNYINNNGFVVISATKEYYPVLAMADNGKFDVSSIADDTPVSLWLAEQKHCIKNSAVLSAKSKKEIATEWGKYSTRRKIERPDIEPTEHPQVYYDSLYRWNAVPNTRVYTYEEYLNSLSSFEREQLLSNNYILQAVISQSGMETQEAIYNALILKEYRVVTETKEHLMTTEWSNSDNSFKDPRLGEHQDIGCTTIAVGQLMKYHRYPTSYPWDEMADRSGNEKTKAFLYDIRLKLGVNDRGAADMSDMIRVLNQFGYTTSTGNHNGDKVVSNIRDNQCPVLMAGYDPSEDTAHAWVCDGYKQQHSVDALRVMTLNYINPMTGQGKMVEAYREESHYTPTNYLYCNWGWGGSYNAYYLSGKFTPGNLDYSTHKDIYVKLNK